MNIELLMYMSYSLIFMILLWVMPNKKIMVISKFLISLLQALPISKIAEAFIVYLNTKKIIEKD